MIRSFRSVSMLVALGAILLGGLALSPGASAGAIWGLEVDAREISRHLLHARMEIPVQPGKLILWYPKWIPGTHAPSGPVQNLAGLRLECRDGQSLPWERDEEEPYRIACTVPDGASNLVVKLDYICNQPTANSEGVDSFGTAHLGAINWNTCLLYLEGVSIDEARVRLRLFLPKEWRYGTALRAVNDKSSPVEFQPETLRDFVDSPLVCGEFVRTIDLQVPQGPPAFIHLISESPSALQASENWIAHCRRLVAEAGVLFGGFHFPEYHFLVLCTDQLHPNGLEHSRSSFNVVGEQDLVDEEKGKEWAVYLLPHEFVHSWCGKYRQPTGMISPDFHAPERTRLLWVYEGLTQYLGEVLMVRSGFLSTNEYLPVLGDKIGAQMRQDGRRWRSLEDTAVANHLLSEDSRSWGSLRRDQDYYEEGLLLWMEADAILRNLSEGRRSLDDFCKTFLGPHASPSRSVGYDIGELTKTLNELASYDWDKFFHDWVKVPQDALPLSVVGRLGYRLQYSSKPSEHHRKNGAERNIISALDSIGLAFGEDGKVLSVIPRMAGDKAGLAPGMMIVGVNSRKFNEERLRDAIAETVSRRQLEFLILEGDLLRTLVLPYADGLKYLELVRDGHGPDILKRILQPRLNEP